MLHIMCCVLIDSEISSGAKQILCNRSKRGQSPDSKGSKHDSDDMLGEDEDGPSKGNEDFVPCR